MGAQLVLLWLGLVSLQLVSAGWPACYESGVDYGGFEKTWVTAFSPEGCAKWLYKQGLPLQDVQPGCERWVFKEVGSACHLKIADVAEDRRELSDPLTAEDREEFPDNVTSPEKTARINQRVQELKQIHTGNKTCFPETIVPWPSCAQVGSVIVGEEVDNTNSTVFEFAATLEDCSLACLKHEACVFWEHRESTSRCTLKTGNVTVNADADYTIGEKNCVGKVSEDLPAGHTPIHGAWSPWSGLVTPCIDEVTGKRIECGGGVQIRYRSCTNPTPRYGGNVCHGPDTDLHQCNTHPCKLPDQYKWSEWGLTDNPCNIGWRKRTSMCGKLRRRLPEDPDRDPNSKPVNWPGCLGPIHNLAPELSSSPAADIKECGERCKDEDTCFYWMMNVKSKACSLHAIYSPKSYVYDLEYVSGEKYCQGTVSAPYCGEVDKTTSAAALGAAFTVEEAEFCAGNCSASNTCGQWAVTFKNETGTMECTLHANETSPTSSDNTVTGTITFLGARECGVLAEKPAYPEDAFNLGFKTVCELNQYEEELEKVDTWNKNTCPSPCFNNGNCTKYAKCLDLSTEKAPNFTCECQMGMSMEGGRCILAPPSTPTPRPVPSLSPAQKQIATAITRTASFVLIGFLAATLILFGLARIMNTGRFIHMNLEVALLIAHVCLLPELTDDPIACRNISICIHFFFTATFAFYLLEGVHMYAMVSYVVTNNGLLTNMGNFMGGWGLAIAVISFSVSFEFDNYGGSYHCWLQMDQSIIFGQYIPILVFCIAIIMLSEAGTNVDEDTMVKLIDTDEGELSSAKWMLRTLFLRMSLTFASFVLGTVAEYEQNLYLYSIFTLLNGILGGVIFVSHCCCNETIRNKLVRVKNKICGKKRSKDEPESTDTVPIVAADVGIDEESQVEDTNNEDDHEEEKPEESDNNEDEPKDDNDDDDDEENKDDENGDDPPEDKGGDN